MPALPSELAGGRLTINLANLADNWRTLAGMSQTAECGAVVKGEGYGIGLEPALKTLAAAGCRTFFVALPEEGLKARAIDGTATIYVLGGLFEGAAPMFSDAKLRPVLGSLAEIDEWSRFCGQSGTLHPCALHIDTGMNRLGLCLDEARALVESDASAAIPGLELVISHFACADTPEHPMNSQQMQRFDDVRRLFPGVAVSFANSAAILAFPAAHGDLIRPGVALYGGGALVGVANPMKPVVTAEARIIQVSNVEKGESVGYGAWETTKRQSRIAILAAGYADGYLRRAGSTDARPAGHVMIDGQKAPLIGRVSMDLIAVDVTGIAAKRGDWAELFGANISIDDVAKHADTIGYELLTGIGRRYLRVYVNEP